MSDDSIFSVLRLPLLTILFAIILIVIGVSIKSRGIAKHLKQTAALVCNKPCKVISKRSDVTSISTVNHAVYTAHYITVEFENLSRSEVLVSGSLFGILLEGDRGMFSIKNKALDFTRQA